MKTIFLDRDGVLNPLLERDGEMISPQSADEFRLFPNVIDAIRTAKKEGFQVIVFTNQPDVGKDWRSLDEEELEEMNALLYHAGVDEVYQCTHGPEGDKENRTYGEDGEITVCYCRKPQPGLIEQADRDFDINYGKSYVIGDSRRDIEAAERFEDEKEVSFKGKIAVDSELTGSDRSFQNVYSAIKWIGGEDSE